MVPSDELEDFPRENTLRKRILIGAIVAGIVAVGAATLTRSGPAEGAPPEFSLPLLDGSGTLSSEDLRGRPVVLNFWASWCIPCREEAPLLEAKWREYGDRIQFVGVNLRDEPADARAFVNKYGLTFPIVRDGDQVLAGQLESLRMGLPQTFFITADWLFSARSVGESTGGLGGTQFLGAIEEEDLQRELEALLESDGAG